MVRIRAVTSPSPTNSLKRAKRSRVRSSMKTSSTYRQLKVPSSADPIAKETCNKPAPAATPRANRFCACRPQLSVSVMVVSVFANGVTRQSLTGATTAPSATDASSRWIITALGLQTASVSTTTNSSWTCSSIAVWPAWSSLRRVIQLFAVRWPTLTASITKSATLWWRPTSCLASSRSSSRSSCSSTSTWSTVSSQRSSSVRSGARRTTHSTQDSRTIAAFAATWSPSSAITHSSGAYRSSPTTRATALSSSWTRTLIGVTDEHPVQTERTDSSPIKTNLKT